MVRSTGVRDEAEPRTGDRQSLGDLVAQASRDISQLVRYEIALATAELKSDARRVGAVSALCGFAAFIGCLILVMLSFALAYGLQPAKVPGTSQLYVCFLYPAAIWLLLALLMVGV